ncbi:MAG: Holliday junction resolvase RuvX [Pseudomonadales bacterium]|jgi:putative Holliday junction resolvase|nr:Holliday junction resolvase RuvX [Pseudomonadales bacterium]
MALESFPSRTTKPLAALSFDFGTQRIGVAFGQSISGTARPVCVLKANDGIPDWEQVGSVIAEWSPDVLVIGLPYNLDGTESELLRRAVKFGNRLNGRFHKPCYGMDERLSSRAAIEQVMEESGSMTKKSGIDDIAAQIILENWFSEFKRQVENIK